LRFIGFFFVGIGSLRCKVIRPHSQLSPVRASDQRPVNS
jgi:hypothetical protein